MLQKVLKAQVILLIILITLNSLVIFSVKSEKSKNTEIVQSAPPDGMKYMEYCEGGISSTLTEESDTSCVAEYPGDFAIFVIAFYSTILFIVFPILSILAIKIFTYRPIKKSENRSHSSSYLQ